MVAAETQLRSFKKFVLLSEGKTPLELEVDINIEWPTDRYEAFFKYLERFGTDRWSVKLITSMFTWRSEPEGHNFWRDCKNVEWTEEAEFKLRSWKARAIAEGLI